MKRLKIKCLVIALALLGAFFISIPAMADLESGLVSYWQFSGNTYDLSGYENHAFDYGATSTTDQFDASNGAYSFNGSSNYMNVPDASALNIETGNFTFSFWARINDSNSIMTVLDKRILYPIKYGYCIYIYYKQPYLQLCQVGLRNYGSGQSLTPGVWSQVIVIVNRGSTLGGRFFINGSLTGTFDPTSISGSLENSADLKIGKTIDNNSFYGGKLNHIRKYNRALSDSEALELYNYERYEYFELKGSASLNDINSNNYSEVANLLKGDSGTYVKIFDSSTGSQLGSDIGYFDTAWTPRSITAISNGTNEDIAVTAINMSTSAAITRIKSTSGTFIRDIDLTQ